MNSKRLTTRPQHWLQSLTAGLCFSISLPALAQEPAASDTASASAGASTETGSVEAASSSDTTAEDSSASGGAGLFESSTSSSSSSGLSAGGFELSGFARGGVFVGKVRDANQADVKSAFGELALQLRTPRETYGDGYADVRFRGGSQDNERGVFVNVREAYVNAYMGPLDLRVGQQIITWGRSSAFAPTNNLTAMDLRIRSSQDEDRRIGNFAARAFLKLSPIRIEGVWQPLYQPVEFPPLQLPDHVQFGNTSYPSLKVGNGTYAGRIHLELPAFEMSASYLSGYAAMPGLAFLDVQKNGAGTDVFISRVAYRQQVIGFDFATTLGEVGLRAEAAYKKPTGWERRISVPHPEVLYVVGLDKTFGNLSLIGQYMGRYTFDWEKQNGADSDQMATLQSLSDKDLITNRQKVSDGVNGLLARYNQGVFQQTAKLQHMAAARVELQTLHETLAFSAFGMLNITSHEWLLFPKILYKFSDHISGAVGAEVYRGPKYTLLNNIQDALSAGYVELKAAF